MIYRAERGSSKAGKHPLLIHRLAADNTLCYKFKWKRSNKESFGYVCLGCEDFSNVTKIGSVNSVRVGADYSEFLSDPESIGHACTPLLYLAVDAEQKYR